MGVIRVDGPERVTAAYDFAARAAGLGTESRSVLVEEYLDGPEVSVECVTYRGETTVVAVTRKTVSAPPFFEELAHSVDASDPLSDEVAPAARAAIGALGITDGVSHVEMRLVHDRPRLIEVNGRIAGDLIGHLVRLATGIDLPRAAADIACDRAPDLTRTRNSAAAIHMIYPETSGTLTALRFDGPRQPWLEQISLQRSVGDRLLLPPEGDMFSARIGFLITTGACAEVARHRGEEALRALTFDVAPYQNGQVTGADPLA